VINVFAPATVASEFDIDGNVNLDRAPVEISDRAPERAVNHDTDSRVVAGNLNICTHRWRHILLRCAMRRV